MNNPVNSRQLIEKTGCLIAGEMEIEAKRRFRAVKNGDLET
jgi:hypothetical protein